MAKFKLEIITPLKEILTDEVDMIIVRTTEGDMGVLANHTPLVTGLAIGEMKIKKDKNDISYFISGGFLEVSKERVLILADKAMNANDIDIEKAKEEKALHESKLKKLTEEKEIALTEKALQESLVKMRIGQLR